MMDDKLSKLQFAIYQGVVSNAIAGAPEEVRNAFALLVRSHDAYAMFESASVEPEKASTEAEGGVQPIYGMPMPPLRPVASPPKKENASKAREIASEILREVREAQMHAAAVAAFGQPDMQKLPRSAPEAFRWRQVLLQSAATRDPLEVPSDEREPWIVNRMRFLSAEAQRVLGLAREEARKELCGLQAKDV